MDEHGEEWTDSVSAGLVSRQKDGAAASDDNVPEMVFEECSGSLCAIGDDSLSAVLSFLTPSDIIACSAVCRHLRAFCKDDEKVWLTMCTRRWGALTLVQKWARRRVRFKVLYSILTKLENLVGFWRGVGHGGHGSLVVFEWGEHYVSGYRVTPSRPRSFGVRKVPFVWIGVSDYGRPVCFFYPHYGLNSFSNAAESSTSAQSSRSRQSPSHQDTERGMRENPFSELSPDWDLEQLHPPPGLLIVDLHFVGKFHIVMEELQRSQHLSNKSLAEAATFASFGSPGHRNADGSSSDLDKCGRSPPGSFHYEMFQFLSGKVASQGGERIHRRQRRREKERAVILGRTTCEPEHFVKVRNVTPTPSRPLQGLWKGMSESADLDFLLLFYNDRGDIVCRRIGECSGITLNSSLGWTAEASAVVRPPLPSIEQDLFNCRHRNWPNLHLNMGSAHEGATGICTDDFEEEVVGMLRTNSIVGSDHGAGHAEGRVWLYSSGRFGFGYLASDVIIDFRPICSSNGLLLDSWE